MGRITGNNILSRGINMYKGMEAINSAVHSTSVSDSAKLVCKEREEWWKVSVPYEKQGYNQAGQSHSLC